MMAGKPITWFAVALSLVVAVSEPLHPADLGSAMAQDLEGAVVNEQGEMIPGAVCTLKGLVLPTRGLSVTTSEKGGFHFSGLLPGSYDLTCAAVGYRPVVRSGLEVSGARHCRCRSCCRKRSWFDKESKSVERPPKLLKRTPHPQPR